MTTVLSQPAQEKVVLMVCVLIYQPRCGPWLEVQVYLAYAICRAVCMCPRASCCLDGVVRERIIFVREGLFISSSPC